MIMRKLLIAGGCTALGLLLCGEPVAQERQVYRYTDADGRVVYSDRAPTSRREGRSARSAFAATRSRRAACRSRCSKRPSVSR